MAGQFDLRVLGLSNAEQVGAGGFAVVYVATDVDFSRQVAVKILHNLDEEGRLQFERERALMGRLDEHPNVITPYRSGYTPDGRPYLVMEYAANGSLRDRLDTEGPLGWDRAVEHVVPVAEALGHAHGLGIEHRDVKPANILVTGQGITKLSDFGIARIRQSTATQDAPFTLSHAAPETFSDGADGRDGRSDLYSLASTLYHLASGRSPFGVEGEDSAVAHMFRILEHTVPPLEDGDGRNAFLAWALEKDPNRRPQSAEAFVAALREVGSVDRGSGPAAAPAATGDVTPSGQVQPATTGDGAPSGQRQPTPGGGDPRTPGGASAAGEGMAASAAWPPPAGTELPRRIEAEIEDGGRGRILFILAAVLTVAGLGLGAAWWGGVVDGPATEDGAGGGLGPAVEVVVFTEHADDADSGQPVDIKALTVLDDGRVVSGAEDRTVRVWHPDEPAAPTVVFVQHEDGINALTTTADGRVASGSFDGTVRVWDPDVLDQPALNFVAHRDRSDDVNDNIRSMATLPDGRLVSVDADGFALVWDPDRVEDPPLVFDGHRRGVEDRTQDDARSVAVLPDGRVATAGRDGRVFVWSPDDPEGEAVVFTGHIRGDEIPADDPTDDVWAVAALPDGRLVSGGAGGTVLVWDPAVPEAEPEVFDQHDDAVRVILALNDGRVVSAASDDRVLVWSPDDVTTVLASFEQHRNDIRALAELPDGRIASGDENGIVMVWAPQG